MSIQLTEPVEIPRSLDFDPEVPDPKKEPEEPKTCGLMRKHPYDPAQHCCGRPATYSLSLKKPCGHVSDIYVCQGCWNEVERHLGYTWCCLKVERGQKCNKRFAVKEAIVRWEKL